MKQNHQHNYLKILFYVKLLWITIFTINVIVLQNHLPLYTHALKQMLEVSHGVFVFLIAVFIIIKFNIFAGKSIVCFDKHSHAYMFGVGILLLVSIFKKTVVTYLNNYHTNDTLDKIARLV